MNITRNWVYALKGKRSIRARQPAQQNGQTFGVFHYQKGGFYESVLCCMSASSGVERWQFTVSHILNTPAVDEEGNVYLSCFNGRIYCLDSASGQVHWQTPTTGKNVNVPVPDHRGRLVVPDLGSQMSQIRCFDTASGRLLWQTPTGGHTYAPTISDGYVVYGTGMGKGGGGVLSCVSVENGAILWQIPSEHYLFHPVIQGGVIYIGSRGELRAYNLQEGRLLATLSLPKDIPINAHLLLHNHTLYFGDTDGLCYAVQITTSPSVQFHSYWQYQTADEVAAQPVTIQDTVAFLSKDGIIHFVEAQTGTLVKQVKLKTKNDIGGMYYHNDRLYVAHGRELLCYDV
ncbi:MAG: PQQ-binding-like beta-propeller repeat protein [Chloroflexota bacterium]